MTSYSKADYLVSINSLLPDNGTQQISPLDLRTSLTDLADSTANFLVGYSINTENFFTSETRTTAGGDLAIGNLGSVGRTSVDNSAFGYYALGGNYTGFSNSAFGSYALGCNLYGSDNTAAGFRALVGNINGSGNVGVGNHTLQSNKNGDFNIAIGHGAGYYIGNNQGNLDANSYKLYVGSHPVNSDATCAIPYASGASPLLYGDLKTLKLGVGVKALHDFGAIQTSGSVSPSQSNLYSLGHPSYNWDSLYLTSGISYSNSGNFYISVSTPLDQDTYPNQYTSEQLIVLTSGGKIGIGTTAPSGDLGLITVAGDILPKTDSIHTIGHPSLRWDGYFNDVVISGNATINDLQYNTINSCLYDCKTLHLATSGICDDDSPGVCGYLSDQALDGAGFEVHSSGSDYRRDYQFIYKFPDPTTVCLEVDNHYSRSRWFSNISLQVESGRHVQTDRVLGRDNLSMVAESGCFGLFIRPNGPSGNKTYLAQETYVDLYSYGADVNFFGASGTSSDFIVSYSSPESGVIVGQHLATRVAGGLIGFGIEYHDEADTLLAGQFKDRLSMRSYNGDATILEPFNVMRSGSKGLVGVTNIPYASGADPVLPETIFNVQAAAGGESRFSTVGLNETSVSLISNGNTKASGLEISYDSTNFAAGTVADFSLIRPSGTVGRIIGAISLAQNGYVGMGYTRDGDTRVFSAHAPLTISHSGSYSGTISLKEQAESPNNVADFGMIYVKPKVVGATQTQSFYFTDDAGHDFDLVRNAANTTDGLLYGDTNRNTYGGFYSPISRPTIYAQDNTSLGYGALSGLDTGDRNVAIGSYAAKTVSYSSDNVVVGYNSLAAANSSSNTIVGANNLTISASATANVIVGNSNLENVTDTPNNVIVIGTGLFPTGTVPDYTIAIGHGDTPIIYGSGGPLASSRNLIIQDSKLSVAGDVNYQRIILDNERVTDAFIGDTTLRNVSNIEIQDNTVSSYDVSGNFAGNTDGGFSIDFADQDGIKSPLMSFLYDAAPMDTGSVSWTVPSTDRPYAELRGDLRLVGAVRFSDGSIIESALGNQIVAGTGLVRVDAATSTMHLDYSELIDAEQINPTISTSGSYLSIAVASGSNLPVGRVSIQTLGDLVGSGFASVSTNCNHIFSNAEASVSKTTNNSSIFIGCNVGVGATGWKHSVIIGSEAGYGATTPNVGLATDTACTFLGYRAGYNADNIDNSIFIGTNAGHTSNTASDSIFIGSSAGLQGSYNNSVGIGENALRGSGGTETGENNIEIVAGQSETSRLMYGQGALSDRININNVIAGNADDKMISIGDAILSPDAPLSVRKDDTIVGHSGVDYIQTWHCNDTLVAHIDCSGNFVASYAEIVEGVMLDEVLAPASMGAPTSGILATRDGNWNFDGDVYVVNRDTTSNIHAGAFVTANFINGTYRPNWVSCSGA